MIIQVNEYILSYKDDDDHPKPPIGGRIEEAVFSANMETDNKGTLSFVPVKIRYPQDVFLLNEVRKKLEIMLYRFHKVHGVALLRSYIRRALFLQNTKKHTAKKI